ncbi:MAG: hypothetical protein ACFWTM_04150 [Mitsuokella multacida]
MFFGFVAPLNWPHVTLGILNRLAACRGVLTSPYLVTSPRGQALRAVTSLLQAKNIPPALVTSLLVAEKAALWGSFFAEYAGFLGTKKAANCS